MASGFKVNGVDLDDIFEPRNGRTPVAPETRFKVNGVDLNNRYLSKNNPESIVDAPKLNIKSYGVDISDIFGGKHNFTKIKVDITTAGTPWGSSEFSRYPEQTCVSKNGSYIATVGWNNAPGELGFRVFIFTASISGGVVLHSWLDHSTGSGSGIKISMDYLGDRLAILKPHFRTGGVYVEKRLYIYRRSGTSWILESEITPSPEALSMYMDHTGTRVFVSSSSSDLVVYRRDGTTWTPEQTISDLGGNSHGLGADSTGSVFIIGLAGSTSSSILIYRRTGTVWSLEKSFHGLEPQTGESISVKSDGLAFAAPVKNDTGGKLLHYTNSGGDWTLSSSLIGDYISYWTVMKTSVVISDSNRILWGGSRSSKGYLFDTPLVSSVGGTTLKQSEIPNYAFNDNRHNSVAASSDFSTVVVTSPLEWSPSSSLTGAFYVYLFS